MIVYDCIACELSIVLNSDETFMLMESRNGSFKIVNLTNEGMLEKWISSLKGESFQLIDFNLTDLLILRDMHELLKFDLITE